MATLEKAFKYYRRFMIIFGTLLGIFLFTIAFIYSDHDIVDALGVSLLGFGLPMEVYVVDHEKKR